MKVHLVKHELHIHRIPKHLDWNSGPLQASFEHFPAVPAHSSPCTLQMPSCHPHIAQRKQRHQLRRVLGQSLVANLGKTKLALDHPERVLYLGSNAGFELLGFVQQAALKGVLVQYPALAGAHGDMPGHTRSFWPLDRSLVTGIR